MALLQNRHLVPLSSSTENNPSGATPETPVLEASRPASASRRAWLFRGASLVLAPVLFVGLVEGLLRWVGFGYPTDFFLQRPVAGERRVVTNPEFGKRFFPPGLARAPRPGALASPKPQGALRVFVLGESAAMGDPDARFGLPRMLEVLLRERFPGRAIEVVNAAVVAINSHVVLPIARECAAREGDLWVVYMGNNEMIGPFGPMSVFGWQSPPRPLIRANLLLKQTRLAQGLEAIVRSAGMRNTGDREWGGMSMMSDLRLRPQDPRVARVYEQFALNLEGILDTAKAAGVPVLLCTVATNVKDCAPFASLHSEALSSSDRSAWEELYRRGRELEDRGDFAAAHDSYRQAAAIDDSHAELAYRRAGCCRHLGLTNEANRLRIQARDADALQFRADSRINAAIRAAAGRRARDSVRLLDAEALVASNSPEGAAGREFFYEHVHFNPSGNYLVGRAVAEAATEMLKLGEGSTPRPVATVTGPGGDSAEASGSAEPKSPWMSQADVLRRLGFTEWHRHHIGRDVLSRLLAPPFTSQADHDRDVRLMEKEIADTRLATKPLSVRRAAEQVSQVVSRHGGETDLHWVLAELLEAGGAREPAEAEWREVVRRLPLAPTPAINLARVLEGLGRAEEAIVVYRHCLRVDPDHAEARYGLGLALLNHGAVEEAVRQLRRAVLQKPRSVPARLAYARALGQTRSSAAARREYEEVLRLDTGNEEARRGLGAP